MSHNGVYEICVEGGPRKFWQSWFEGVELLSIQPEDDQPERTLLIVSGNDPATPFGILAQIGSLNLRLISVELRPTTREEI
jgi:hypothetical protein